LEKRINLVKGALMDRIVEQLLEVKSPAYKEVVEELALEIKQVVKR